MLLALGCNEPSGGADGGAGGAGSGGGGGASCESACGGDAGDGAAGAGGTSAAGGGGIGVGGDGGGGGTAGGAAGAAGEPGGGAGGGGPGGAGAGGAAGVGGTAGAGGAGGVGGGGNAGAGGGLGPPPPRPYDGTCVSRWDCLPGWVCDRPPGHAATSTEVCHTEGVCVDRRFDVLGEEMEVCACNGLIYRNSVHPYDAGIDWYSILNQEVASYCTSVTRCGSTAECGVGEYCERRSGYAPVDWIECGLAGVCSSRPTSCVQGDPWPVCGCDGIDYASVCEAAWAGISIQYEGPCTP